MLFTLSLYRIDDTSPISCIVVSNYTEQEIKILPIITYAKYAISRYSTIVRRMCPSVSRNYPILLKLCYSVKLSYTA